MKNDNADNGSASAATSATSPASPARASSPGPAANQADFLRQQAQQAEAAIGAVASDIKRRLREGVNPIEWAREYPLLSIGVAAVAGFVGAAALIPSKEEQAMARLAALERALHPKGETAGKEQPASHDGAGKGNTFSSMLVHEMLGLIRPVAISLVTGLVGMKAGEAKNDAEAAATANARPEPDATAGR